MSHAQGIVFSRQEEPQILGYFEYNGTVDICQPIIEDSLEGLNRNWRKRDWKLCIKALECTQMPVYLYNEYGDGCYWNGLICDNCKVIIDGFEPDHDTYVDAKRPDGLPTSYELIMAKDITPK